MTGRTKGRGGRKKATTYEVRFNKWATNENSHINFMTGVDSRMKGETWPSDMTLEYDGDDICSH